MDGQKVLCRRCGADMERFVMVQEHDSRTSASRAKLCFRCAGELLQTLEESKSHYKYVLNPYLYIPQGTLNNFLER